MSKIPSIAMIPSGYKANKVYSVLPTNGDADLSTTRASTATRVNQLGLIEEVATGVPRLDYSDGGCPSLLLEPTRTNLFLNSDVGVTQTITVVASSVYSISFSGTGAIAFSGGATGSLVGTGSLDTDRVSTQITPTTTSVTCTITGTVENVNFELGSYSTSHIPTTGITATRVAETASKTGLGSYINSSEGVLYLEISALVNGGGFRAISLAKNGTNAIQFYYSSVTNSILFLVKEQGVDRLNLNYVLPNTLDYNKIALKYKQSDFALWVNGVEVDSSTSSALMPSDLSILAFDNGGGVSDFYGKIKDLRVYDKALTDVELQTLTTL